ncbi:aconitase X catalytic domain-containing protein [Candidatus Bathyarchaeota archaeon]|nr:aconitase X catalytic domain-containing protein [Candidatus Bathyarchaeota archaeon]
MHLTREEERIYCGEHGWASQMCMKILIQLGDLFKADRLIPIRSAHVSGVSYKTLGDAPIEFLKVLADAGGRVKVRSTLNPQSFDPDQLGKKLPEHVRKRQQAILDQFDRMGFKSSLTCTPYYLGKVEKGWHLAWAESSAVVYANSVLRAYTNREGGPSALAAALIGKTPNYGVHQSENRKPSILVHVEDPLMNEMEHGTLGIYLGRILGDRIPFIEGLKKSSSEDLKQLGAGLAASGMTNMFLTEKTYSKSREPIEKVSVKAADIRKTCEELSTNPGGQLDLVFVGCPHCSLREVKRIARLVDGKKIRGQLECWVCTSRYVKERAMEDVKRIEKAGARVLVDMCTIVSWTEKMGIKSIMTNSAKTAYYAPTLNRADTRLASLEECLKTAFRG